MSSTLDPFFATLPPTTPSQSGASTPRTRAVSSSSFLSTQPSTPQRIPVQTRDSIYSRLTRNLSSSRLDADDGAPSTRRGIYRDAAERAQKEGNPESWGALMMAATGQDSGSPVSGAAAARSSGYSYSTGGPSSPSAGPGTSGFSIIQRRASSILERPVTSGSLVKRSAFYDEPSSYSAVEQPIPGDENGDGLMDDEEVETLQLLEAEGDEHEEHRQDKPPVEDESDSDSDDESPPARRTPPGRSTFAKGLASVYPPSPVAKNVIKCIFAYFLAELFTFVPWLSELVGAPFDVEGPVRNAHVIATVAVYFNPAKTIGSMIEADLFMLAGLFYAVFLCCGSMAMTVLLDNHGGHNNVAHVLVLFFWIGGGYGLLSYVKVKVNKPTLSTACSMVSLIASVIITKEGAFHVGEFQSQAISQVTVIVFIGASISNFICFALWPGSATSKLQADLNKTLNSFSTLLEMLTKTFLLDEDITTRPESLKKAIDAHQASFTVLKASLEAAKYEIFDSRIQHSPSYDKAVQSMTRLAQGLTGMRSGCTLQYDLMRAQKEGKLESDELGAKDGKMKGLKDELLVFEQFRERVGKSLQQLSWTSKRTLALLRTSFVNTKAGTATLQALQSDDAEAALSSAALLGLKDELQQSLVLFKRAHSQAIKILYQRLPANLEMDDPFAHPSEANDGPNDNIFRIYFFCFNFEGWVRELDNLVDSFISLRATEEKVALRYIEIRNRWGILSFIPRTWDLLRKVRRGRTPRDERVDLGKALRAKFSKDYSPFPEIVDGALSSHQVPSSQLSLFGRLKQQLWRLGWHLKQPNVIFSVKTGAGAAILASTAFIPSLRPYWLTWRGEWSLISYMVVMAPTIGATNFLAFGRIVGTVVGAVAALGFYSAFPGNSVVLPILGALFSAPCFYVIVTRPQYGPSSRFVLLTFNLTCLYSFNLREEDTHVGSVAMHRAVAVGAGVIWGLFINLYVWPFEARRELRKGLSDFFLNAAYLYERLVQTYSVPPPSLAKANRRVRDSNVDAGESTALLTPEAKEDLEDAVDEFVQMEVYLQLSLIKLSGLLAATSHEPRLKGPFPSTTYRTVLSSCQAILDLLSSMRNVTTRDTWYTTIRRDYVIPCNLERREMVGNVVLYFSVLSSAVSLKTPLPAYLPPASEARNRLVKRLYELPIVRRRIVRGGSEGLLYLAYALSMKDVISHLDSLGSAFQKLFGIIGGASSRDAFEALFLIHDDDEDSEGGEHFEGRTPA